MVGLPPVSGRPIYWLVIAMTMGVSSVFSYVWLFCTIRGRLAPGVRKRLFPRQLQSLAVAGFVFNVFLLPILYIDLWTFPDDMDFGKNYDLSKFCTYAYGIFRTARSLSVLQEMHLALTFLAQAMRWAWALPLLNRAIPVVWLGGFTLGVLDSELSVWTFSLDLNTCVEQAESETKDNPDLVSVLSISFCAAVSLVSFACTLRRSASSSVPNSVRQKNYKRAAAYPAVTVISYSCVLGAYIKTSLFETPSWYWPIASILQASNGVLNTVTFYSQSRYASMGRRGTHAVESPQHPDHGPVEPGPWGARPWGGTDASPSRDARGDRDNTANYASWHVDFGGVDIIDIITLSSDSSAESGRAWRNLLHFPWDYDETADVDAWTVQDLIDISLQERSQLTQAAGAGADSRGVSLQVQSSPEAPDAPDDPNAPFQICTEAAPFQLCPEAPDVAGDGVSRLNTEERMITEEYFERLSDEEAFGTAREFDLSTPGGRRRAKRRGAASSQGEQLDVPERRTLQREAEDLRAELASLQAQADDLSEAPLETEQMPSCLSLATPEQTEYCD